MTPPDPNFKTRISTSFQQQTFMAHLGAKITSIEAGAVNIEMPVSPEVTQQHGFVHAGAVASIADSACGYSALTLMPKDAAVLTVEYKINLLSPAVGETLVAEGRVKKPGKTIFYCTSDVYALSDGQRKLVASLVATIMTVTDRGIAD